MSLPISVGDFSDFSLSMHHVLNAGEAVMGVRALPPGFSHFPIGYAGRSSSVVVSGTPIRRPLGQYRSSDAGVVFGPSKAMDFELEVACVVGKSTKMGNPVSMDQAAEHLFGFVLLNDWSARDIQALEMNPLGPFVSKSSASTISPWIVTMDALDPFLVPEKAKEGPISSYLKSNNPLAQYQVNLRAELIDETGSTSTLCNSQLSWLHWTFRDMIAHQTINGCAIRSGDLLASGTVSGASEGTQGCLLEMTKGGKLPITLPNEKQRTYLEDGDAIRLTGWAGELGSDTCVGFGESFGRIEPAIVWKKD